MKRIGRTCLLSMALLAGVLSAAAQEAKPTVPNKARDLIEQAIAALGGEAYLKVREIEREGSIFSFSRGELANPGVTFIEYYRAPYQWRRELGKKRNIIYVNNDDEGWELDPQGIREQTPEAIADFKQSVDRDIDTLLRQRHTEPDVQFYYLSSEFIDNRRVDIIEMVDAENESYILYLDGDTHLPTQLRYRERDTLTGEMVDVVEYYGTYLDIQGVRTPRQITGERAGLRTFEAFLRKVKFNGGIPDQLFTRDSLEEIWRKIAKKKKKKDD